MSSFSAIVQAVTPPDKTRIAAIQEHLDLLTKPVGSLGKLEHYASQLALICAPENPLIDPAIVYTVAGDHGVVAEDVSLYPQEVTRQMVMNFLAGGAAINVLTKTGSIDLKVVDAGCMGEPFIDHPDLIQAKVRPSTRNMLQEPAMTPDECMQALQTGTDLAKQASEQGYKSIGTGEMGIGNSTSATALFCGYLDLHPEKVTGPGTGLDDQAVVHKAAVIKKALNTHASTIAHKDPLAILACLGGFEIACLTGIIIGAAKEKLPVVIDGFISTAAFVAAWKIQPHVMDYAFFSHGSSEPGHKIILEKLDVEPMLSLEMRLGEGTGAALALPVLRSAAAVYNSMASFTDAGVSTVS